MALGEEEAEAEVSVNTKIPSCGRWNSGKLLEAEQPLHLEVEGGPLWGAEADPGCISAVFLSRAHTVSKEPVADRSQPPLSGPLPSASVHSQMEENKLPASQNLLPTVKVLGTITVCAGREADDEDFQSAVDPSQVSSLSQQPHISGLPLLSPWKSTVSPGAPQLSSRSLSASAVGISLPDHQEKAEPQSGSFANVSSPGLTVPQAAHSGVGAGPQLQGSAQPVASGSDAIGLGKRHLSFQAEYWACVLPNSLPPSPNRHSPLWNPNKEYEDLLNYTYPLRPGPQLPKQPEGRVLADLVMQDSGVDLDSFSVSPASTLKSPSNVSHNCSSAEGPTLPFSGAREPCLKRWPLRVSQKQGGTSLASWNQLASTPKAPGTEDASWENREAAMMSTAGNCLPIGKDLSLGSPQLKTKEKEPPFPRRQKEERGGQGVGCPACVKPGWPSEEEAGSDEEYLALPERLTQVSSLVSSSGARPTFVNLPREAAEEHSSLQVSDGDEPASPTLDSSQRQHPSGATFQGPVSQDPCFRRSLQPQDSLGLSSKQLKTHPSSKAVSDRWLFSELVAGEKLPRKTDKQEKASLVQCVQSFCCQLEELICWLYNVPDVADLSASPRASLTGLKSSLQLYRQFKKDINEHQSLTESVLEKGEILLQCLLENTPGCPWEYCKAVGRAGEPCRSSL
ncbi:centrosomal protein of 68 kDa isoform X2 [Apodemus sylvaticus]|uniref:centrosomal protein of 68 kDa isoform X2 n=1 Tax=Apodemus sylvaticus TaxID=10129 RepID=UPI00224197BC|nr:centrosomal protein of 68 kDa isoform X2 [Apodemus sylvaticus]